MGGLSSYLENARRAWAGVNRGLAVFSRGVAALVASACAISVVWADETRQVQFHIVEQRADTALTEFARQANLSVLFPYDAVSQLRTKQLVGTYRLDDGLEVLLDGTGLEAAIESGDRLMIRIGAGGQKKVDAYNNRRRPLAAALAAIFSSLASQAAVAQAENQDTVVDEVLVTGSRMVRRDFEANSPITTIDGARFEESSTIGIESVMNQLPQFVPSITQFTPLRANDLGVGGFTQSATRTPGAASLSLRGLGPNRNLVLIDGRRGMPVNAGMAVSINSIPSAAVARVETITGGASSVYGADAISGVVNFVLKRDFEGIDINTQWGTTVEGGGDEFTVSMLLGGDIVGGRGNVMLGLEMADRDAVANSERKFYRDAWMAPDARVGGSAFHPLPGIQMIAGNLPSQAVVNTIFSDRPNPANMPRTGTFYMNPDGTLHRADASGAYRYNGSMVDPLYPDLVWLRHDPVSGELWNWRNNLQLQSPMRRYSMFGRAHLDIGENLSAFTQLMVDNNKVRAVGMPVSMSGGWRTYVPHGNGIYEPSLNADGTTHIAFLPGGRHGLECPPVGGCTKSQVWPKPPEVQLLLDSRPDPEALVHMPSVPVWYPPRGSESRVTTYQFVTGLEGRFPINNWTWEAFVSHGANNALGVYQGLMSSEQWRFITNQPNYGKGMFRVGGNLVVGGGASVELSCTSGIPMVYGAGGYDGPGFQVSEDCIHALSAEPKTVGDMEQTVAEYNMQGDLVSMPAGDLLFAVGASYRENSYQFLIDRMTDNRNIIEQTGGIWPTGNAIGDISAADVYGELLVPLLVDKPGFQSLNLELGYRYSRNKPNYNVDSYKALVDWRVHDRVRLRGGRQVANRAPNMAELFQTADTLQPSSSRGDWCSDLNPVNQFSPNPTLNPSFHQQARALCEAMMGPVGSVEYYSNPLRPNAASVGDFQLLSGNLAVKPEVGETSTAGLVVDVTDRTVFTIDYWRLEITDMISNEIPNVLYERCLSPAYNPTFDPTFHPCTRLSRDPETGAHLPTHTTYTNESAIDYSGYDVQLDWAGDVGLGTLTANFMATISKSVKTRVNPESPWTEWKGTSGPDDIESTDPYSFDYRLFTTVGYRTGLWTTSLRWRHLPSIESSGNLLNPGRSTPTGTYNVFDLAGRYNLRDNLQIRFGIDNVFDADPEYTFPVPAESRPARHSTNTRFYDLLGRRWYVGMTVQL